MRIESSAAEILNTSVYEAWKSIGQRSDENIILGYRRQGEYICRGVDAVVKRALKNGEDVIVETLYFIPEALRAPNDPGVIAAYIYVSDIDRDQQMIMERSLYTHPSQPGDRLLPHAVNMKSWRVTRSAPASKGGYEPSTI